VLGKVSAWPQRICHDSHQAIWEGLDHISRTVMERVRVDEPQLFSESGELDYETARSFRGWARLFDEVSPQILSRLGVSAFTALRRVAPDYFGWNCAQLKPWSWSRNMENGKARAGGRSSGAPMLFALYEYGLGSICEREDQVRVAVHPEEFLRLVREPYDRQEVSPYGIPLWPGQPARIDPSPHAGNYPHTARSPSSPASIFTSISRRLQGSGTVCMRTASNGMVGNSKCACVLPDLVRCPCACARPC